MASPASNNQEPVEIGYFAATFPIFGGAGYGFTRIFTNLNPISGAAFGLSLFALGCGTAEFILPSLFSKTTRKSKLFEVISIIAVVALAAFFAPKMTPLLSMGMGHAAQIPGAWYLGYSFVIGSTAFAGCAYGHLLYHSIFKSN